MKTITKRGCMTIGILDSRNYVVYDHTKPKYRTTKSGESISFDYAYYTRLDQAVREIGRRVADDQCEGMTSWLEIFRATNSDLVEMFTDEAKLSELRDYALVKRAKRPVRGKGDGVQATNGADTKSDTSEVGSGAGASCANGNDNAIGGCHD